MKRLLFITILFCQFQLTSQTSYILDNIFGLNLKFKMSVDSVQNKYPIKLAILLDSSTVNINGKTLNIERFADPTLARRHHDEIFTYLYAKNFPDSLFTLLDFRSGKLIQATIFYKGDKRTEEIKKEIMSYFKLKEFNRKANNKITKTYLGQNDTGYNYLTISDKKAMDLIPSWCGNDSKKGSWTKLDKYLSQTK